jgi:hypothetical protein
MSVIDRAGPFLCDRVRFVTLPRRIGRINHRHRANERDKEMNRARVSPLSSRIDRRDHLHPAFAGSSNCRWSPVVPALDWKRGWCRPRADDGKGESCGENDPRDRYYVKPRDGKPRAYPSIAPLRNHRVRAERAGGAERESCVYACVPRVHVSGSAWYSGRALSVDCPERRTTTTSLVFGRVALEERQHESTMHPRIPLSRCGGGRPGPAAHTQLSNIRGGAPDGHRARIRPVSPPWAPPVPPCTDPYPLSLTPAPRRVIHTHEYISERETDKDKRG